MKTFFEELKTYFHKTDKALWLFTLLATVYSLLLISSMQRAGEYNYLFTQCIAVVIGLASAIVLSIVNYNYLVKKWWIFAAAGFVLVAMTFVFGVTVSGTDDTGWVRLPGGITFQPSEFVKVCFIITFARHLSRLSETNRLKTLTGIAGLLTHLALPVVLIHMQGDDGAVLIFFFIALVMAFLAGIEGKYFVVLGGILAVGLPTLWKFFLNDEHRNRINALFDLDGNALNDYGWQQYQSKVSIASGEFHGAGLYQGKRVSFGIVPEQENDFIFSVAGEELGFIGCMILFIILVVIAVRIILDAKRTADNTGSYICFGVFALLASQTIINLGMVLGLVPVIGITLPLFSSGGTSVIAMLLCIGMVQSVMYNREKDIDKAVIRRGSENRRRIG